MTNSIMEKFIETELNAYITDQRLIPQDNLVRLIAKAFEAYDQYRRLVSSNENPKYDPKYNDYKDKPLTPLHPRIKRHLDKLDRDLYSCPDLDQDFSDPQSQLK